MLSTDVEGQRLEMLAAAAGREIAELTAERAAAGREIAELTAERDHARMVAGSNVATAERREQWFITENQKAIDTANRLNAEACAAADARASAAIAMGQTLATQVSMGGRLSRSESAALKRALRDARGQDFNLTGGASASSVTTTAAPLPVGRVKKDPTAEEDKSK